MSIVRCPKCQTSFDSLIPIDIEPMFTLAQAAALVPMGLHALRSFLREHKEIPVRYRQDIRHRRHRMVYASEIKYIRNHLLKTYYPGTNKLVSIAKAEGFDQETYPTIDQSKYDPRWKKRNVRPTTIS